MLSNDLLFLLYTTKFATYNTVARGDFLPGASSLVDIFEGLAAVFGGGFAAAAVQKVGPGENPQPSQPRHASLRVSPSTSITHCTT